MTCLLCLVACSSHDDVVTDEPATTDGYLHIIMTRTNEYQNTTYRAMLFDSKNGKFESQGTYCLENYFDWLTPCKVNDGTEDTTNDGSYYTDTEGNGDEDTKYGLRYWEYEESHNLTLHTPAVALTNLSTATGLWNATSDTYGYSMSREPGADEKAVYFSDPIATNNKGVYLGKIIEHKTQKKDNNGDAETDESGNPVYEYTYSREYQYVYDASELKLKERRCKIHVTVQCGENRSGLTVTSLKFNNLIKNAYYEPGVTSHVTGSESVNAVSGDFAYSKDDTVNIQLLKDADKEGFKGYEMEAANDTLTSDKYSQSYIWLFPMDYETTYSTSATRYHPVPTLELTIAGISTPCSMPLPYKFEPQTIYYVVMIVNTVNIHVNIYARDWENEGTYDINVDAAPTFTADFKINTDTGGWEKGNGEQGEKTDDIKTE